MIPMIMQPLAYRKSKAKTQQRSYKPRQCKVFLKRHMTILCLKHFLPYISVSHSIAFTSLFANNLQHLYMLAIIFPSLMPLTSIALSTSQIWGNGSSVDDNSSVWHFTRSGRLALPEELHSRAQTEPTYFRYNRYLWRHGSNKITSSLQSSA